MGQATSTGPSLSNPQQDADLVGKPSEKRTAMANKTSMHSDLQAPPTLLRESLYIGVDSGKFKHVAGFVSKTLLELQLHFESCPAFLFEQSREGFRAFVERIEAYCPLEQCFIVMEPTGHYHRPLLHYLLELDLPVYVMHVQSREATMLKTDKRDALGLANHLYNQLALGVQVSNKLQVIRRAVPLTATCGPKRWDKGPCAPTRSAA